jgi:hypothetical protein
VLHRTIVIVIIIVETIVVTEHCSKCAAQIKAHFRRIERRIKAGKIGNHRASELFPVGHK